MIERREFLKSVGLLFASFTLTPFVHKNRAPFVEPRESTARLQTYYDFKYSANLATIDAMVWNRGDRCIEHRSLSFVYDDHIVAVSPEHLFGTSTRTSDVAGDFRYLLDEAGPYRFIQHPVDAGWHAHLIQDSKPHTYGKLITI